MLTSPTISHTKCSVCAGDAEHQDNYETCWYKILHNIGKLKLIHLLRITLNISYTYLLVTTNYRNNNNIIEWGRKSQWTKSHGHSLAYHITNTTAVIDSKFLTQSLNSFHHPTDSFILTNYTYLTWNQTIFHALSLLYPSKKLCPFYFLQNSIILSVFFSENALTPNY